MILGVAIALSAAMVLLVIAAWRNDRTIESSMGTTSAEVLSAGSFRSAVRFVTPDGVTHTPVTGVLYPTRLTTGQRIQVEYDRNNPDLVRVAGRDASVAIVPAGSVVAGAWIIAVPVVWAIRRRGRTASS